MTNLRKAFRRLSRRSNQRRNFIGLAVLLFAAVGILALYAAQADTFIQTAEAENGVVAGNAKKRVNVIGASGGTVLFGATQYPQPMPFPSVTGPIKFPVTGLCLDIENGVASPTTPIRVWHCNGAPAQTWTIQYTKYGANEIRALGQCLTTVVTSTGGYALVYLSPCNGSLEQLWLPDPENRGILNYKSTIGTTGDRCLDVSGSDAAGTHVGLWTCTREPEQNWEPPVGNPRGVAYYLPFNANVNKCLDLPSGNTAPGTQLQVWDCNHQNPQYMTIGLEGLAGSRAKLSILAHCLEVKDGGTADGTPVQINVCTDDAAQDWEYMRHGSSTGFKQRISGKCIDTDSGQVTNSARLVIKTCNPNAPGQQFGR